MEQSSILPPALFPVCDCRYCLRGARNAALPLFVGGLGLFGLFGWRRKRSMAIAA